MITVKQWTQAVAQLGQTEKVFVGLRRSIDTLPVTGAATPTIQMLRQGVSTFSTISPSWTEAGNGVYLMGLTSSMKRTAGGLVIRLLSASTPTINDAFILIVGANPEDEAGNISRIRNINRRLL